MKYTDFINSKDVKKHLEDIKYQFSPTEAAWVIYHSRKKTIKERHEAWDYLIKHSEDCAIKKRVNAVPQKSLHVFLKRYMEIEDKCIEEYNKEKEDWIYCLEAYDKEYGERYTDKDYSHNIDEVSASMMQVDDDGNFDLVVCEKRVINDYDHRITVIYDTEMNMLSIQPSVQCFYDLGFSKSDRDIFYEVFDGLWFDIPTPFKAGDILIEPYRKKGLMSGPMVLRWLGSQGYDDKTHKRILKNGDNSDMNAWGYFTYDDGQIYADVMDNYVDLEYYPMDELKDINKTVLPFSQYLKGEIDLCLFTQSYIYLLSKNRTDYLKPSDYTKDGLKLVGIE